MNFLLLAAVGFWAGVQNALAGGGTFLTLPALLWAGLDPRAANIASTIALFPGQIVMSWRARNIAVGVAGAPLKALVGISLAGGAAGAALLLTTPVKVFAALIPWLVLFATALFALGDSLRSRWSRHDALPPYALLTAQAAIAVYGGFFGGGIGFLMLAALSLAGIAARAAGGTKNFLAAAMNLTAVAVFAFAPQNHWPEIMAMATGAVAGAYAGSHLLLRLPVAALRVTIIVIGIALSVALFLR
jgi:uncharacterized membrane protein YfcA